MEIKISEDKLEKIIDIIVNGVGINKYDSFQARTRNDISYVEFLTPRTREYVISRYYPELVLIVVNDEKLYDLISDWVGSHKVYDLIKDELIKGIYKIYTNRFTKRFPNDIWNIKYMNDENFNKR
jgi:predicted ATP-grasp superfamily ATP-dependent carboligase